VSKDRITVSLEPEVASYLQQDAVNASGLVNNLVKKQMGGKSSEAAMVKLRLEQVSSKIEQTESALQNKRGEKERLEERLSEIQSTNEERLEEARQQLKGVPKDPDNPAIQNWAEKLDLKPSELLEKL